MAGSPFHPGMDPWLEAPDIWPDVHQGLAYVLREQLTPALRPRYAALVYHEIEVERIQAEPAKERRSRLGADVAIVGTRASRGTAVLPALKPAPLRLPLAQVHEVKHFRLEIVEVRGRRLVTVVEILSRANKQPGKDRRAYERKRQGYLDSYVHFVELDLLRTGKRWTLPGERTDAYRVLVSRALRHRDAEVWPISVRDPLPVVPLPLLAPDPDVPLDLPAAMARVYEGAGYDALLDYGATPPAPPFAAKDAAWVKKRLGGRKRRR